jgi:hypothetical protein
MIIFFLLFFTVFSHAQNFETYVMPRIIYVGDPATLVVPLPGTTENSGDIILAAESVKFLSNDNFDFHRITLERRTSGSRLLVEFTAFVPGVLELPAIEIGNERFYGLTVSVASVINLTGSALELSRPAPALVMPGTAMMIYGTMTALVLLLLSVVWFCIKGRAFLQGWIKKWKRWRLFASMLAAEKRLYRNLSKGGNKREILDKLSDEFRVFLSCLTNVNCRAMTAREFIAQNFNPVFLSGFFRRCDNLRFSGTDADPQEIYALLADLRKFITVLENERKEKPDKKEEIAA